MSKYWGLGCIECDQHTDHIFNHGDDIIREYVRIRRAVDAVATRGMDIGLTIFGSTYGTLEFDTFLETHKGHTIVLHSEYGDTEPLEEEKPDGT